MTPSWQEVMAAIAAVEVWLHAVIAELRDKYPDKADILDRLDDALKVQERSIQSLVAIAAELQVLRGGKGPVVHDPVDHA